MELSAAYKYCRRMAFGHYENFPVASLLLPQPQRDAIAAVYAFARRADDFSDEPFYAPRRKQLLLDWRARLDREPGGHPVFTALEDARRRWKLPKQLLADLVQAFLQDCDRRRYDTFEALLAYCRLSAEPVGRLVLRIFGQDSPAALRASDDICAALQLANHWQDLASDALVRDRIYLPGAEMRRFGVDEEQLRRGRWSPGLGELLRLQVDRAEALFASGQDLPGRLPGRLGLEIRLTLLGGRGILRKIRAQGYDTLKRRPRMGALDAPGLLWAGLSGRTA
ncbi:MAG TPA: squalene synthase HpnC [bacterium]|jgi:squalene synthase HpnC|nr:squalene synthase HpnC [bacterium]